MKSILKFIASAISVMIIASFLPGVKIADFNTAMLVVIVFSLCNMIIRPILILFTLPITFLTLGLFLLVINVMIVNITDSLILGFKVNGFINALLFSFLLSILSSFFHNLIDGKKSEE